MAEEDQHYTCFIVSDYEDDSQSEMSVGVTRTGTGGMHNLVADSLPTYIQPSAHSVLDASAHSVVDASSSANLKEKTGTVLKLVGSDWKDRYLVLKPAIRALYYYETLAKAQNSKKPLGVYPLIGASISEIMNDGRDYRFSLILRTRHTLSFKVLESDKAAEWRRAIRAAIKLPIAVQEEGEKKGVACLKASLLFSSKRNIILDYNSKFLWTSKKNDDMTHQETVMLEGAEVVLKKSYGDSSGYDISIEPRSKNANKLELKFKTAEEWADWGTALEGVSRGGK